MWELVAYKMTWDLGDWAYAECPFAYMLGFSHDGICITEEGEKGVVNRCIKHERFQPVRHCDYQSLDMFTPNQFAIEERSVGPKNIIRPIVNKSTDYIPTIDADGRGIVCFYDKLWLCNYIDYQIDDSRHYQSYKLQFEFVFQPVSMERFDYFQHLIDRTRCSNMCYEQDVFELPCISKCLLKDARDYEDDEKVKVPGKKSFGEKVGERPADEELTGLELKRERLKPEPCWRVCEVSNAADCIDFQKTIDSLKQQLAECKKNLAPKLTKYNTYNLNVEFIMVVAYWFDLTLKALFPGDGVLIPWNAWYDNLIKDPKPKDWESTKWPAMYDSLIGIAEKGTPNDKLWMIVLIYKLITVDMNGSAATVSTKTRELLSSSIMILVFKDVYTKTFGFLQSQAILTNFPQTYHFDDGNINPSGTSDNLLKFPYYLFPELPVTVPSNSQTKAEQKASPESKTHDHSSQSQEDSQSHTETDSLASDHGGSNDHPTTQETTGGTGEEDTIPLSQSEMETDTGPL